MEHLMTLEELEEAFGTAKRIIRERDDGLAFVPIAQRLEREIASRRDLETDYERYLRSG